MMKLLLIASILFLGACGTTPELPDPTATPFPNPPAELMRPPQPLETIE